MVNSTKPRICYILPVYDPDTGSHFFHLYEFLERAARELDIFVVIEKCKHQLAWPFGFYCQKFSFPPLRMLELLAVLTRERLAGRRYFYTHYSFYGAIAAWLVTRIFGGQAYYWNSGMPWNYRRPWFEERVFRFILRHTILVTNPPGLAVEYRRRYGLRADRIRIVPHYISVQRFQAGPSRAEARARVGIPPEAKVILFVHRLSRRKGAHLIPEIAVEVTKREKNAMFIVVGDGPERKNLESRIQNLELREHVRLVGEVPQRDIVPYFRAADALLMPSEEEGFPHVLLEAMAAGVPYVASDVGGVREATPPALHEYVLQGGNPNLFAGKILALFSKWSIELSGVANTEREWVQRYDIQAAVPQFLSLFRF